MQSNLGALGAGVLPQAASSPPTGLSGLGSGLGGALGNAAPMAQSGPSGPGQAGLPTLNLLGGAMSQGSGTPQNIQQMQAQAVQSPTLDSMCPGKQRSSTNVGAECWAAIWTSGGCKAENLPKYEEWHQTQSLEILVGDVVQWANLPDERHKTGCYGDKGAPENLPAPPMPTRGMAAPGAMAAPGGMGQGMTAPGQGMASPLGGLGGGSPLGLGAAPQGPAPPPEVSQKIMSVMQSPDLANICPGVGRQATAVGEACWKNIWKHVGCLESTTPGYEEWHNAQSFEVLVADAAQWASLPSPKHRQTCFGTNVEL